MSRGHEMHSHVQTPRVTWLSENKLHETTPSLKAAERNEEEGSKQDDRSFMVLPWSQYLREVLRVLQQLRAQDQGPGRLSRRLCSSRRLAGGTTWSQCSKRLRPLRESARVPAQGVFR